MKLVSIASCLLLFCRIVFCDEVVNALNKATIKFAFDILKANGNLNENVLFSPASISTCIGMAYAGANGTTKSQINKAVFNEMDDEAIYDQMRDLSKTLNTPSTNYSLSIANRVYYAQGKFNIFTKYVDKLVTYLQSEMRTVDFGNKKEAANEINSWVERQTNNKIKNLISGDSLDEVLMVLVNAIYFKGDWSVKFTETKTDKKTFYATKNKKIQVDMMKQNDQEFYYAENENVQVLGLPYKSNQLAMYVTLPKQRDGLQKLESNISEEEFINLIQNAQRQKIAEVQLPKFKLEHRIKLVDVLKTLGMTDMFNRSSADFSGITDQFQLYVSAAIHKAFIEVNEKGSEAAAATGILMGGRMAAIKPIPEYRFIADHPFLFSIVDRRTWNPLFFGRYVGN